MGGVAMEVNRHPGISMHKLPVGPGFIGLVFTVGCALIFLLGLPQLWYFVVLSAVFGAGVAIVLRLIARNRAQRMKPLSILEASEIVPVRATDRPSHLIKAVPVLGRA
jgi:hypothetical protein